MTSVFVFTGFQTQMYMTHFYTFFMNRGYNSNVRAVLVHFPYTCHFVKCSKNFFLMTNPFVFVTDLT